MAPGPCNLKAAQLHTERFLPPQASLHCSALHRIATPLFRAELQPQLLFFFFHLTSGVDSCTKAWNKTILHPLALHPCRCLCRVSVPLQLLANTLPSFAHKQPCPCSPPAHSPPSHLQHVAAVTLLGVPATRVGAGSDRAREGTTV